MKGGGFGGGKTERRERLSSARLIPSFLPPPPTHSAPYGGGGIYLTTGNLTATNVTFLDNAASDGGALMVRVKRERFCVCVLATRAPPRPPLSHPLPPSPPPPHP